MQQNLQFSYRIHYVILYDYVSACTAWSSKCYCNCTTIREQHLYLKWTFDKLKWVNGLLPPHISQSSSACLSDTLLVWSSCCEGPTPRPAVFHCTKQTQWNLQILKESGGNDNSLTSQPKQRCCHLCWSSAQLGSDQHWEMKLGSHRWPAWSPCSIPLFWKYTEKLHTLNKQSICISLQCYNIPFQNIKTCCGEKMLKLEIKKQFQPYQL